jgi:hypothetical protein
VSRKTIYLTAGILSVFLLLCLLARTVVPSVVLKQVQSSVYQRTGCTLSFDDFRIQGLATASFSGLRMVSAGGDTIVYAAELQARPAIWSLLGGHLSLKRVHVSTLRARFTRSFLRDMSGDDSSADSLLVASPDAYSLQNLSSSMYKTFERFFPEELLLEQCAIAYTSDSLLPFVACDTFALREGVFRGSVTFGDVHTSSHLVLEGSAHDGEPVHCSVHGVEGPFRLPYVTSRWNIDSGFDTLNFSVRVRNTRAATEVSGSFSGRNVYLFHTDVSPDTIRVGSGGLDFLCHIRGSEMELDSLSVVHLNGFRFSPHLRYQHGPDRSVELNIPSFDFDASTLLKALPRGLFQSFSGLQTEGRLAYRLHCFVPFNRLDSLEFSSNLDARGFRIVRFGEVNPYMLRDSFYHQVYERGRLVAAFPVYRGSPRYVPLELISDYLTDAVLTSEDGSFFYHRGFNEEAFRDALALNLKKRRFVRGASTITMQLVKNVFLTRQKTLSRKLEEVAWVWMIENLGILDKHRMLEVYFNIVEWGPGIYGIRDAAQFYFNKAPSALTLSECIYLSMLLPRPKQYVYFFDDQGNLRPSLAAYIPVAVRIMLHREWIAATDTLNLVRDIRLSGPAAAQLRVVQDTIIPDSTLFLPVVRFP